MSFDLILGSDWLRQHNPLIDWHDEVISFTCCDTTPVRKDASGKADRRVHSSPIQDPNSSGISSPDIHLVDINTLFSISDVVAMGALRYASIPAPTSPPSSTSTPPIPTSVSAIVLDDTPVDPHILQQLPPQYHDFADIFRDKEVETLAEHRPLHDIKIEIQDDKTPPFGPIYSLTSTERQALHEYIEDMLRRGFIRPSSSPAASPILFVKKKNGSLRICVDYRGLNAITKRNTYPLPLVNDLFNVTRGSGIFTKLDLKSAFNLLRIAPGDEWKTAFRTNEGLFEYLVMPFGLTNAPAAWQSFMQWVLREQLDITCIVYLDDILIFSRNPAQHHQDVRWVLEKLRSYGLYCNVEKCEFDRTELEYLGYLLSTTGIRMDPSKLKAISSWPVPSSVKSIQKWLGFTNFYRRFIDNYASLAAPLHALTGKSPPSPFILPPEALDAFNLMRDAFSSAPVLIHFDDSKESFLYTDASDYAIAAILQQHGSDGELHPVGYFSRKLQAAEINYDVHDKEMLAIMASLRDFRHWLSGTSIPISIITDHKNLQYFMTQRVLNRRQARWMLELSEYNFRLSYAPGSHNPADAPSRRDDYVTKEDDPIKLENSAQLLSPIHFENLHPPILPSSDPRIQISANHIFLASDSSLDVDALKRALASDSTWTQALERGDRDWSVSNDVVLFRKKMYVPPSIRLSIIQSRHDSPLAGHFGAGKTIELITRDYSWPNLPRQVRLYVQGCDSCQRVKVAHHAPYGKLQPLDIPSRPWQSISMDFITGLPLSHGFDCIWVVVDRLTKQSHFIPTTTELDAPALSSLFIHNILRLHGSPESIISDRGSVFISSFWQSLQSTLGTDLKFSTAYHPQSDGQTERVNAILENYLRHYASYQQDDWVDYLPLAEFSYNNSVHDASRVSPFFANFGFHPTFSPSLTRTASAPAATEFAARLSFIRDELKAELQHAQDIAKSKYDVHRSSPPSFAAGDLVMLLRRNLRTTRPTQKLDFRKLGPFKVIKKLSANVYQLDLPPSMSRLHPVFNINLLEPYISPSSFPGRNDSSSSPIPIVDDSSSPGIPISAVLDVRRIGRRFDYLVDFEGALPTERAWIPISDIPATYNEILERFHRRHPSLPRPSDSLLLRTRPLLPDSSDHAPIADFIPTQSIIQPFDNLQLPLSESAPPAATSVLHPPLITPTPLPSSTTISTSPNVIVPPPSSIPPLTSTIPPPSPKLLPLTSVYTPPSSTTTRSGRVSRPSNPHSITTSITSSDKSRRAALKASSSA